MASDLSRCGDMKAGKVLDSSVPGEEREGLNCVEDGVVCLRKKGKGRPSRQGKSAARQARKCVRVRDPGSFTSLGNAAALRVQHVNGGSWAWEFVCGATGIALLRLMTGMWLKGFNKPDQICVKRDCSAAGAWGRLEGKAWHQGTEGEGVALH